MVDWSKAPIDAQGCIENGWVKYAFDCTNYFWFWRPFEPMVDSDNKWQRTLSNVPEAHDSYIARPLNKPSIDTATPAEWDAASRAVGWGQPTEEEERAWKEKEKKHLEEMSTMCGPDEHRKQTRYIDNYGRDWIDECAATMTVDEFRGAMKFTIGKYVRRAGKKDALESEIRKIEDYARRWAEYEASLCKG